MKNKFDQKEIAYIQKGYNPTIHFHVDIGSVYNNIERWYICWPDGSHYDTQPYKTAAAAKAALTRIRKLYQ